MEKVQKVSRRLVQGRYMRIKMKDYSREYRESLNEYRQIDEDGAKSELDSLYASVKGYRTSKTYRETLEFCSRFKQLAPFNAMMVQMQRPSSKYVLTAKQWMGMYGRTIIPNARPVVILSFQPVSYLYDISDTERGSEKAKSANDILDEIKHQYDTKQEVSLSDLNQLIENLAIHGIAYSDGFRAGAGYGAQILFLEKPKEVSIRISKDKKIKYNAHYLISVNETLSTGARYASIMHELGYFFCHHLVSPQSNKWWKTRYLSHSEKEFEAESVAWLTCERLNIDNPSERYLAGYLSDNLEIPQGVSVDHIIKAHNKVWELLFNDKTGKDGFLYKYDENFKKMVDGGESSSKLTKTPPNN